MNSPRATAGRTLGSVRVNKGSILPPLTRAMSLSDSHKVYFQDHQLMISGDAVHTSLRGEPEGLSTRGSASRPMTSRVEANHANNKILEDLRELQTKERQQKNKIGSLHKSIEQLKSDMKNKEEECISLQTKFEAMEEHYRKLYEEERASHSNTKGQLAETQQQLTDKLNLIEELKLRHEQKITEINDLFDSRFQTMQEEKDKEIAEKDERISKLKNQMAEILKGNSWERQQQLEELSKELTKVSEETNMLKMKLKSHKNKKDCDKCEKLHVELEQKNKTINEKEALVKQMKTLCSKFETQLTQQDIIMKQFAESRGHKVNYNPK